MKRLALGEEVRNSVPLSDFNQAWNISVKCAL